MQITREFLEGEMREVRQGLERARHFIVQAETSLALYQMLIDRLDQPEPTDGSDLSEAPGSRG
jgi:hypothetical protein